MFFWGLLVKCLKKGGEEMAQASGAQRPKRRRAALEDENAPAEMTPRLAALGQELSKLNGWGAEDGQRAALAAANGLKGIESKRAVFRLGQLEKKLGALDFLQSDRSWKDEEKRRRTMAAVCAGLELASLSQTGLAEPWSLFSSKRFVEMEEKMLALCEGRDARLALDAGLIEEAIARKGTMEEEQAEAARAVATGGHKVWVVEGTAGAGKSFTLEAIKDAFKAAPASGVYGQGFEIIGCALTWVAANVLVKSAKLDAGQAIQGLVMDMDAAAQAGEEYFKGRTLLIVDEAGLVGMEHMHKLLSHANRSRHPVKVVLTGDSLQLNPVKAGNALESIVHRYGSSRLDSIRRQALASHRQAVKYFCEGAAEHGLWTYWQQEAVNFCKDAQDRRMRAVEDCIAWMAQNPDKSALILALENAEVKAINEMVREKLKKLGRLPGEGVELPVSVDGKTIEKARFCVGDRIALRKNEPEQPVYASEGGMLRREVEQAEQRQAQKESRGFLHKVFAKISGSDRIRAQGQEVRRGVFNRTAGVVKSIAPHPSKRGEWQIAVLLEEGGEAILDTSEYWSNVGGKDKRDDPECRYVPVQHNFACTIYSSQGQTVDRVFLLDSPTMNSRLAYVGMSRHREMCDIYLDCAELAERMDQKAQWRSRAAQGALDQAKAGGSPKGRIEALGREAQRWQPGWADAANPAKLLAQVAQAWGKSDDNPTPKMAQEALGKARAKSREGPWAWHPRPAPGQKAEDEHRTGKAGDGEDLRHSLPAPYEELAGAGQAEAAGGEAALSWPAELGDPLAQRALARLKGKLWGWNRWGFARFWALDPKTLAPLGKYSAQGKLAAGFPSPLVFNSEAGGQAPWMVAPDLRSALMASEFYRDKAQKEGKPEPNVLCWQPECDLGQLEMWVKPGQKTLWCAWSAKDPEGLEKAHAIKGELEKRGHRCALYPDPAKLDKTRAAGPKP